MKKSLEFVILAALAVLSLSAAACAAPTFGQPALITTAGQSIEAATVDFHFQKAKVASILDNLAKPDKLEGVQTLVIAPGHSLKGLGSAGINETAELERVKKLVAAAVEKNIPIVCVHIGGKARRGVNSQPFIDAALEHAACCLVYDAGNEDGYFTDFCAAHSIPLITMQKSAFLAKNLIALFPKQ
ncbi:MAG: hypothetical protein IJ233_13060 [Pyramidobacter sp.]|nr:hypothetical protein [Pyramidobacter sp.]